MDICNTQELKSPQGMIVQLDTTYIQQNFLLDEDEEDFEEPEEGSDI